MTSAERTATPSPSQWLVAAMAALGFAFDQYEILVAPLIVRPVLSTVGGLTPGSAPYNTWVGLLFFVPAATGGLFGLLGGYLTDRFGRRRILVWSILLYGFATSLAAHAGSLPAFLIWRCVTWVGVCVEFVAAVTWIAELFPVPRQRETVLAYAQACIGLGGLLVTGVYYLTVTYGHELPPIRGGHDAWRYTLLFGLLPAIPLMLVRPFLPESQVWLERKAAGALKRPSVAELFRPELRRTTLLSTLLMACCYALPYGAIQHVPRIVPGLAALQHVTPLEVEQTVSTVQMFQELGALAGRLLFAVLVVRLMTRQRLLRTFLLPALVAFSWLFFVAATSTVASVLAGIFVAAMLFNPLLSFWGNYLPRMYPTHLRATGESFATNIGGRIIGTSAAMATTQLSMVMPGAGNAARLANAAGSVAAVALVVCLVASRWMLEPAGGRLPD